MQVARDVVRPPRPSLGSCRPVTHSPLGRRWTDQTEIQTCSVNKAKVQTMKYKSAISTETTVFKTQNICKCQTWIWAIIFKSPLILPFNISAIDPGTFLLNLLVFALNLPKVPWTYIVHRFAGICLYFSQFTPNWKKNWFTWQLITDDNRSLKPPLRPKKSATIKKNASSCLLPTCHKSWQPGLYLLILGGGGSCTSASLEGWGAMIKENRQHLGEKLTTSRLYKDRQLKN